MMLLDSVNLLPLFTIVLFRTASVLFFSPIYNQANLPFILKVGLAIVITFAVFPAIGSVEQTLPDNMAGYILLIFKEVSIGFLIGYTATLAFGAFAIAGELISTAMGIRLAELVNPLFDESTSPVSQMFQIVGVILFLGLNGHHWLIKALVFSYQTVPITGFVESSASINKMIQLFGGLFVSAIKIAAPVMIILMIITIVSGFLARSAPQLNIFLIIFPMKIIIGMLILAATFPFITRSMEYLLHLLRRDIFSVVGVM